MPNTSGRAAKRHNSSNESGTGQKIGNNNNNSNSSTASSGSSRARKRKRCEVVKFSDTDLESEFEDCDMEDALAIERKLRKVAKNNSLTDEEMRMLLHKFVKNDHILALVTLKAEDVVARERREAESRAILITDTPSVLKLTRAKARELNKTPGITLPSLMDTQQPEMAALIQDDLHSDEDDEEYTFQEEDFISDDDPNTTISDLDSNPRTPQTPLSQYLDSPVKLTEDGCFKVPCDKGTQEDLRIATRTRSKFCLQQTTIEDLQSEFVLPAVEQQFDVQDADVAATDEDWMEFLNDFSKPLNSNLVADDDDPINDPEYVAAEKIRMDAEEFSDINISKKELTELVAELFEGLVNEGVSFENIELETPHKFVQNTTADLRLTTPEKSSEKLSIISGEEAATQVVRQIDFDVPPEQAQICDTISDTHIAQHDYSFQPQVVPSPAVINDSYRPLPPLVPISRSYTNRVTSLTNETELPPATPAEQPQPPNDTRYTTPYDSNFTWQYISVKRHVHSEYLDKFENLRHIPSDGPANSASKELPDAPLGFTRDQHDMLQQQLRLHVQMLTQSYVQMYSHPEFWKLAPKAKDMLNELREKAKEDASYNAWNLNDAVELTTKWEEDLSKDSVENTEMMKFVHKEIHMTNRNSRQIPRFPPRVMDLILDSCVFMYPQYLPRIPFTPKVNTFHIFSPAESQLIAFGLEKHVQRIRESGERLNKRVTALKRAGDRLSKDTIFGKTTRRIWDHIRELRKAKYYNPVKYFYEHNRAPPIEPQELFTFANNTVLKPKERFNELPLAWQKYIEKKNSATVKKVSATTPILTASERARASYLEFVREAVSEDLPLPDNFGEAAQPNASATGSLDNGRTQQKQKKSSKKINPTSLTINVNYVFGAGVCNASQISSSPLASVTANSFIDANCSLSSLNASSTLTNSNWTQLQGSTPQTTRPESPVIAYNYDLSTQTLQPVIELATESTNTHQPPVELEDCETREEAIEVEESAPPQNVQKIKQKRSQKRYRKRWTRSAFGLAKCDRSSAVRYRDRRNLQKRCESLITVYRLQLQANLERYPNRPLLQHFHKRFKALELYSDLLIDLEMFCRNAGLNSPGSGSPGNTSNGCTNNNSPNSLGKRPRSSLPQTLDDEAGTAARSKKAHRQEENFRHMLLPDTAEDANRKDAIYAFNFYEKVEEVLKSSNRPEDCKRFNHILKTFDPKCDKVANLYYKLENLFLPDYPELAQVFLTFLLPSEAAEIGKFFEHFMINNVATFINKLNIYFNKQPAQIRKIYNCLNELVEDPDITVKKIEAKILPLLKGNQFLIDWFMQQFPEEPPPERLLSAPEHINLKEVLNNQNGEFMETVTDILDSPTSEQQPSCQLRYINGRIFYGSKMTLPAKLSFMATNCLNSYVDSPEKTTGSSACVHGIREHGEKRLAATAAAASTECNSDDNDKSEEEDLSKALIIDTTEEDSSSSIETCDDATLRAHAIRLNPSYYSTSCFTSASTSTPNPGSSHPPHHPNARKSSLNFNEEGKISPRKHATLPTLAGFSLSSSSATPTVISSSLSNSPTSSLASTSAAASQSREKRKSPTKKTKSPLGSGTRAGPALPRPLTLQPMVVIHEHSSAIACAKKLKSLIEEGDPEDSELDSKEHLAIVARTKNSVVEEIPSNERIETDLHPPLLEAKVENSDDFEFLPLDAEITATTTLSQSPFPAIKIDDEEDDHTELPSNSTAEPNQVISSTHNDSDEDCKLDIVVSLATSMPSAWSRDEDKIILIEMKLGSSNRDDLFQRLRSKLPNRTLVEITGRHQFLMDFLSKLQGK